MSVWMIGFLAASEEVETLGPCYFSDDEWEEFNEGLEDGDAQQAASTVTTI